MENKKEDIENLKSLLYTDNITICGKRKLVKYYEDEILRQKKINEEHQKINGELREKVKELEKKNEELEFCYKDCCKCLFNIKQRIKDLIKKYEWATCNYDCNISDYKQSQAIGKWNVLQEILQESEDKNEL